MTARPVLTLPTRLLVSVRSAAEAEAALQGGADLIDVKEPARGPLGQADDATLVAVIARVAGRRPVSAARGELVPDVRLPHRRGLSYVKWGLAGWLGRPGWRDILRPLRADAGPAGPGVVVAAYADWCRAAAPPVEEVAAFAREQPGSILLIDTYDKGRQRPATNGLTLLDWLPLPALTALCASCREAGVYVAVAGSLGPGQVAAVRAARPDWLAVRGAACRGGRDGTVSAALVRALARLLAEPGRVARRGN
jgi:uncharacterized protein (UPF0264 family)